jgi:hypothetical protein
MATRRRHSGDVEHRSACRLLTSLKTDNGSTDTGFRSAEVGAGVIRNESGVIARARTGTSSQSINDLCDSWNNQRR